MARMIAGLAVGCMTLAISQAALADSSARRSVGPVTWHVAGGYSEPTGQISDYLQGGWVASGGFTYAPNGNPLGLRGDVSYSSHNATNNFLDYGTLVSGIQVDSGTGQFFSFSLGPSYTVPFIGRSHLYGFAQLGVYHSSLQLTQRLLFSGYFCDPYFGFCQPGVTAGDDVVYDDSRTRVGWNVGIGIEVPSYFGPAYYIEAAYHRLGGDQAIEYIPIQFGIRF
jgi:hypothetical protein